MDFIIEGIRMGVGALGVNTDFVGGLPTILMKPLSGSGARGMMLDAMNTYGADSFVGRLASHRTRLDGYDFLRSRTLLRKRWHPQYPLHYTMFTVGRPGRGYCRNNFDVYILCLTANFRLSKCHYYTG